MYRHISELTNEELIEKAQAGTLDRRRAAAELMKRKQEARQIVQDVETAEGLAAVVKARYLAERSEDRRQAIIKAAMAESLERMAAIDEEIREASRGANQSGIWQLEKRREGEEQFQIDIMGSAEAVARYYLETVNAARPDPAALALANIEKSAAAGDPLAQYVQTWRADEKLRQERPDFYAVKQATVRPTEEERAEQFEYLEQLRRGNPA